MDEYSEFEELGDNAARDNKKTRINPQHLQLEEEEEEEYFVESILERKIENGREEFLVKWEGYSDESNTWEPRSSIKHLEVFKVFEKEHKKQRSSTKKVKNGKEEKGGADQIKKWEKFFEACCDLPTKLRKKYASTFVKQRIQPNLLRDLGKDDLKELGISALGDQLAIISYINYCDGTPPEFLPPPKKTVAPPPAPPARTVHQNDAYVDDDILMPEEEDVFSPTKPVLSIAPDRHDIYHIKIPTGESNSKRAKNVLEVHNNLREQRVIKRGVTGVRRSGMELHSVSSHSKPIQKQTPLKPKPTVALVVQAYERFAEGIKKTKKQLETMESSVCMLGESPTRDAPSPTAGDDPFVYDVDGEELAGGGDDMEMDDEDKPGTSGSSRCFLKSANEYTRASITTGPSIQFNAPPLNTQFISLPTPSGALPSPRPSVMDPSQARFFASQQQQIPLAPPSASVASTAITNTASAPIPTPNIVAQHQQQMLQMQIPFGLQQQQEQKQQLEQFQRQQQQHILNGYHQNNQQHKLSGIGNNNIVNPSQHFSHQSVAQHKSKKESASSKNQQQNQQFSQQHQNNDALMKQLFYGAQHQQPPPNIGAANNLKDAQQRAVMFSALQQQQQSYAAADAGGTETITKTKTRKLSLFLLNLIRHLS